MTFWEALDHFKTAEYVDQHYSHVKPTVKHRGCAAIGNALFGPPKMKKPLHGDRNLIFAMALCMFDNDVDMHGFVLQTIYKKLTGTNTWPYITTRASIMQCIKCITKSKKGGNDLLWVH